MSSSFPQPSPRLSSSEFLVHFHYAKRNLRIIGPVSKYILYTINILAFIRSMAKCVCTKAACQGDEGTSGESKKRHRKTVTYIMYGNISCNGVRFHFIIPLFCRSPVFLLLLRCSNLSFRQNSYTNTKNHVTDDDIVVVVLDTWRLTSVVDFACLKICFGEARGQRTTMKWRAIERGTSTREQIC